MPEFKTDFKNITKDAWNWVMEHGPRTTIDGIKVTGLIDVRQHVINVYHQHEQWDALIHHLKTTDGHWDKEPGLKRLIEALVERRDVHRLKRLLGAMITGQKGAFWANRRFCMAGRVAGSIESEFHEASDEKRLLQKKADLLRILSDTRSIMTDLGEAGCVEKLREDYESIEREERKTLPKAIDRAMDEDCFWNLIEDAKRRSQSTSEQMDLLQEALEAFKAAGIKKFQRILDAQLDALLHWDVWALGYVAMDGCSDDSFEYFRCWVVLQGRGFVAAALEDVQKLQRLPSGNLAAEDLLSLPGAAYERRSGKPLLVARRKAAKMQGEEWQEEDLEKRYPILCRRYA